MSVKHVAAERCSLLRVEVTMTPESEFITHLKGFSLTEKEASCYFYLLKYGPKTPSPLAKSLKTYREDMHRTLNALIDKGMVRPSLDSPTIYAAVNLETALESALKKHESELKEMEKRKRELEQLALQQQFHPSIDASTFKVLKSIREILAETTPVLRSTEKEFIFVAPADGFIIASQFGVSEIAMGLAKQGGRVRGIAHITYAMIPHLQRVLAAGEEIRHYEGYRGLYFGVFDRQYSVSAININVKHLKLDEPATMLFTNDPVYSKYLVSTFELLWQQATPAEERIQELLEQGPSKADQ